MARTVADGAAKPVSALHVAAVTAGNGLEFYDFITYALFAIYIGKAFFPSHDPASSLLASLATFGAGFLTRPIGGMVLGSLGDRIGRKPALLISFALMGLGMAGIALTPDYASIGVAAPVLAIVFRLVQGFALGGEVGPSTAFLMEAAPPHRRATYAAMQNVSQGAAILVASTAGLVLSLVLNAGQLQAFGWRLALLLGVAIVPFGLWMRRSLPETFSTAERASGAARAPVRASAHGRVIVPAFFLITSGTMATYVGAYMTTYAIDTLHMSPTVAFGRTVLTAVIGIVCVLASARLSDRFGRRPLMIWPIAAQMCAAPLVFLAITRHPSIATLYVGTSVLATIGGLGGGATITALAESVPREIRSGVLAGVYAFAVGIFGGSTQLVIRWLIKVTGDPMIPGWYLTGALVLGLIAALAMPESAPVKSVSPRLALASGDVVVS